MKKRVSFIKEKFGYGHTFLVVYFDYSFETISTRKMAFLKTGYPTIFLLGDKHATITMGMDDDENTETRAILNIL